MSQPSLWLVGERGRGIAEGIGLVLDGLDDLGMLVPERERDDLLRRQIEVPVAIGIPEPCPLSTGHRYEVQSSLGRPGEQCILQIFVDYVLCCTPGYCLHSTPCRCPAAVPSGCFTRRSWL